MGVRLVEAALLKGKIANSFAPLRDTGGIVKPCAPFEPSDARPLPGRPVSPPNRSIASHSLLCGPAHAYTQLPRKSSSLGDRPRTEPRRLSDVCTGPRLPEWRCSGAQPSRWSARRVSPCPAASSASSTGDTLVVAGVGTVRLIGVDTPETVDPRKQMQFYGHQASAFTKRSAEGRTVRLEFEGPRKDRYDRTLAYVYLDDGTLLNADLIRQGYGSAYTQFPFSHLDEFRQLERGARLAGRGLWAPEIVKLHSSPFALAVLRHAVPAEPSDAAETVYATRTGAKYHRAGCRHLARSQIPMSLEDASARYGPCSVCRPPVLTAAVLPPVVLSAVTPLRTAPAKAAVSSGRCQATTKKGTQCSRKAQAGRSYCWQH